jgi:hypothetical protein
MWDLQTIYGKPSLIALSTFYMSEVLLSSFQFLTLLFCYSNEMIVVVVVAVVVCVILLHFYYYDINLRPWSYDTCSRGSLQHQQEFSACNKQTHFDFLASRGRGKFTSFLMLFVHVACSSFVDVCRTPACILERFYILFCV